MITTSIFIKDFGKVYAAGGVSQAKLIVPGSLIIVKVSDLDFGAAMAGTPFVRIPRGSVETPENASFLVLGIPGSTITISVPPGSIFLNHATSTDTLEVRNFRSRPNGTGRIRNSGERLVFVGATRRAIPAGTTPGLYTGTFTVDVVY